MKSMEYTIKVTTDDSIDTAALVLALKDVGHVTAVEVTNYRIKSMPRKS